MPVRVNPASGSSIRHPVSDSSDTFDTSGARRRLTGIMAQMTGLGTALDWSLSPLDVIRRWPSDRRVLFLHSGRTHQHWARWSVLGEPQATYRFLSEAEVGRSHWSSNRYPQPDFLHKPFADLRRVRSLGDGIWIGYLSYDIGRWIERLPTSAVDDRRWPIIEFGYCPGYLVYDGIEQCWHACGTWRDGSYPTPGPPPSEPTSFTASQPRSIFTRGEYERAVAKVKNYIAAGDVFQVNLAQRFTAAVESTGRNVFHQLATVSPAWYGAYLELTPPTPGIVSPAKSTSPFPRHFRGRALASTSPELFLRVDANGTVTTRPIKGTRPADVDPDELRRSEKDAAELHMIVDLLRNDLGRVCNYGTIKVLEPRAIETHPTVHHGVATITGQLHPSKDAFDLLRATMPGGSITGAPKVRAMQIIDELEPVRRGPYCGAIGYLNKETACFNIAIRTMLIERDLEADTGMRVDFSVGGGIVADSEPDAEYDETITKAQAMFRTLQSQREPAIYI